jgi:hypothetical protein
MVSVCFLALVAAAAATRVRRIDEPQLAAKLLSPGMHRSTAARHARVMRSWSAASLGPSAPVVYPITFGADPTGETDSTAAFTAAMASVLAHNTSGHRMSEGIIDLGGCVLDLQGGDYLLSSPLIVPAGFGNVRIIDGSLRATPSFPATRYLIEVGGHCTNGQGSCNENVGMSGLTLDGSHVAAGCLLITATMGATLDSSSAIFGFTKAGILLAGGHETMITETWVAAYFWDSPKKEAADGTIGISIQGNDHFVTNVIVFSAQIGVQLNGAANLLTAVHTWNDATGNGGTGILNAMSQNRFISCYLDFTDLILAGGNGASQTSVSEGFFLGGGQIVFQATKAGDAVFGVALTNNVWFDTGSAALAVNETLASWASVTDLAVIGTTLQQGQPSAGVPVATMVTTPAGAWPIIFAVDFSSVLLFPSVPIASFTAAVQGPADPAGTTPPTAIGIPSGLTLKVFAPIGGYPAAGLSLVVTVSQSKSSTTFTN